MLKKNKILIGVFLSSILLMSGCNEGDAKKIPGSTLDGEVDLGLIKSNAGKDVNSSTLFKVTLDGSKSVSTDSYSWSVVKQPEGSNIIIENNTSFNPYFTPSVNGMYKLSLKVSNDDYKNIEDFVEINVSNSFETTWKNDLSGNTLDGQIKLNVQDNSKYNVNWGDGYQDMNIDGSMTHTYSTNGEFNISIYGKDFGGLRFEDGSNEGNKLLSINKWGDINFTSFKNAFYNTGDLEIKASDTPNLSSVSVFRNAFNGSNLGDANLSSWDMGSSIDLNNMFSNGNSNPIIDTWETGKVQDIDGMFSSNGIFNRSIDDLNLSSLVTSKNLFYNALSYNQVTRIYSENLIDVTSMLEGAISFNEILLLNTPNLEKADYLVKDCTSLNSEIAIGSTNLRSIVGMFQGDILFDSPITINSTNLIDISSMFEGATLFNQPIVLDTTNVTNISKVLKNATMFNQSLSIWDMTHVTESNSAFEGAISFDGDVTNWNVARVVNANNMFNGASLFNQDISGWDVSSLVNSERMFSNAGNFNQDISGWNTSKVENFNHMLSGTVSFNQNISLMKFDAVKSMIGFLDDSVINTTNYDGLLTILSSLTIDNIELGAANVKRTSASDLSVTDLTTRGWTITDGGI